MDAQHNICLNAAACLCVCAYSRFTRVAKVMKTNRKRDHNLLPFFLGKQLYLQFSGFSLTELCDGKQHSYNKIVESLMQNNKTNKQRKRSRRLSLRSDINYIQFVAAVLETYLWQKCVNLGSYLSSPHIPAINIFELLVDIIPHILFHV